MQKMEHIFKHGPQGYFLYTPIHIPEYTKVPLKYFSDDIIQQYSLEPLQYNEYIYIEIKIIIYRLKKPRFLLTRIYPIY